MDFDELLVRYIGEFGLFQRCMFALTLCSSVTVAFHSFIHTFTGASPDVTWFQNCVNNQSRSDVVAGNVNFCHVLTAVSLTNNSKFIKRLRLGGYNQSYINTTTQCFEQIWQENQEASTILTEWGLMCGNSWKAAFSQSSLMAGTLFGTLILGAVTDRFAKPVLLATTIGNAMAGTVAAFSDDIWMYSVLRFCVGFTMAGQFNAAYVLSLELVGPKHRALAALTILLFHSLGMMLLASMAYLIHGWRMLQVAVSIPSAILALLYALFLVESPRWLIVRNRHKEALQLINKIGKVNNKRVPDNIIESFLYSSPTDPLPEPEIFVKEQDKCQHSASGFERVCSNKSCEEIKRNDDVHGVQSELIPNTKNSSMNQSWINCDANELHNRVYENNCVQFNEDTQNSTDCNLMEICRPEGHRSKYDETKKHGILELFKSKIMIFRTVILFILWLKISITYYGLSLHSSSLGSNTALYFFFIGAIEIPAFLFYHFCNKWCSRRGPVGLSLLSCGVVLLVSVFVSYGRISDIILFILGKLFISLTFASIYPLATELYPTSVRTVGLALTSVGARTGALIAPFICLLDEIQSSLPLIVFSVCSVMAALCTYSLPEPKAHTLPQTISDAEKMHISIPSCACCKQTLECQQG